MSRFESPQTSKAGISSLFGMERGSRIRQNSATKQGFLEFVYEVSDYTRTDENVGLYVANVIQD